MTLVHFAPVGNGTTTPRGYIEGRPVGFGDLPDSFRAVLVDGEVTHEVTPTEVTWAWNFIERVDYGRDEYATIDDEVGPVEYDDLTKVNGDDFSPTVAPSAGWQAALGAGLATKVNTATLDGDDLTLYGGSFTDLASGAASGLDPEEMYFNIFATEYDGGTVTTYGKAGTRIDYTLASLLSTGTWPGLPAPVAGALWPGTSNRPGDVVVDTGTNDAGRYGGDGVTPVAIAGSGGDNYMEGIAAMHEAVIALASTETRIELGVSGGTPGAGNTFTGAGWSIGQAAAYMSGGAFSATSNEGDKVSRSITPPQIGPHAGRVFVVTLLFDSALALNADVDRVVDGGTASRWTAVKWESYGSVNVAVAVIPVDLPIDGAAHTVELIHAGTTGQYFSPDVVLIPSETPGDIYFMQAPDPVPATLWDAAEVAIWKANRNLLEPEVRTAIGLHANALWSPCKSMTPGGYWTDGIHPGVVGMIQRAADLGAAFSLRKLVGSIYKAMVG